MSSSSTNVPHHEKKVKSWPWSAGVSAIACLTIVIEPYSVLVNVQVTSSPEFRVTTTVSLLAP